MEAGTSAARSRRITIWAVVVALMLCAFATAAGSWVLIQERDTALRLASVDATHLARQVASDAATLALLGDKAAVDVNRIADMESDNPAILSVELDTQAALLPGMHSGAVYGARGQRLAASKRYPEVSEQWLAELLERHRDGWEDMVVSSSDDTGVPHTFAVSRSRWSDGLAFGGFTVSLVDLSRLREWSEEQGRVSASTVVLILADGTVVAWLAKGGPGNPSDGEEMRRILASHLNSESIAENGEVGADRSTFAEDAVIGIGLARDFPFIGIVLTRTADVLVDWRRLRNLIVGGLVLMTLAVATAVGFFVRGEWRRGRAEEELRISEERLAAALENGNLSLWDLDVLNSRIVFGNGLSDMLDCEANELADTVDGFKELIHPDDKARILAALQAHINDPVGHPHFAGEYRLRRKSGGWTWIADQGRAVKVDANGRAVRVIGVHADITRRKLAEEELHKTYQALEDSNRDLEQFAYIASHDLQEPLRIVSSYLSLLLRREGDRLSETGQSYANTAADGAKRMGQLIRDLLDYSRVGTRGETPTPQDTAEILSEAVDNLAIAIEEAGATVTVQPGAPPVLGDRSQLVRLVQNLVGNALKYRAVDRPPDIQIKWISNAEADARVTLSVSDNGIGIDSADFDRIFQIFQRLHNREEYEGTGIGLAVCRRIVERHGGKLWVESKLGVGSTFYVTLPAAPADALSDAAASAA